MSKSAFAAKKSHDGGAIQISADLASGWGGPHIKVQASATIPVTEARAFAAEIIAACDAADAKAAKKQASEDRRKAWRDREIAAGRMRIMSINEATK